MNINDDESTPLNKYYSINYDIENMEAPQLFNIFNYKDYLHVIIQLLLIITITFFNIKKYTIINTYVITFIVIYAIVLLIQLLTYNKHIYYTNICLIWSMLICQTLILLF